MPDIKVFVELEVPENFKPCENVKEVYIKGDCPFNWTDYDMGCQVCNYEPNKDCPMLTIKNQLPCGSKLTVSGGRN